MYRDLRKIANLSLLIAEQELKMARKTIIATEYHEQEPHPNQVVRMDNLYNANKKLAFWHCGNMCSVGKYMGYQYIDTDPITSGIYLLGTIKPVAETTQSLIDVLQDGKITPDEIPLVNELCERYRVFRSASMAFEIAKEKALQ